MSRSIALPLFIMVALLIGRAAAQSEWRVIPTLDIPPYNYSFLAATPNGDLLAATFNVANKGTPPVELPALLIRNINSGHPEAITLTSCPFDAVRGYGGMACDSEGNFYVSGDTGEPATCFVCKFHSDGTLDTKFGVDGYARPNLRCLGVEVLGKYLFVSVGDGTIFVLDADTARVLSTITPAQAVDYVRDIAIDPKSMRIFGVRAGSVVTWGGGAPWNTAAYQFYRLTGDRGELRSGEGISMDPIRRTILITPIPGNVLYEIHGNGTAIPTAITTGAPTSFFCDSVLSFDGRTLYVSDILGKRIHVLKRDKAQLTTALGARAGSRTAISLSGETEKVTWHHSYTEIVQEAREAKRPMVVYFGRQDVPKCKEVQEGILLTETFNQHASKFVCVYEDVAKSQLIAYRFGAYRVPYVAVLDEKGELADEFVYNVDSDRLFATMRKFTN